MKSVFIVGSCVSRDILSFDVPAKLSLDGYFARSSLTSIFSSTPFDDVYSARLSSKFQQQIVHADIVKEAKGGIANSKSDIILVDFIDERFNLLCTKNGVCTISSEFMATGAPNELKDKYVIASGTDEFFELWIKGWSEFFQLLKDSSLIQKLRLNKVFWASETETGRNFMPHYSAERISAANKFLQRLYDVVEADLQEYQILNFSTSVFVGADMHRWGISPFHYTDSYYIEALNYLVND